MKFNQLKVGVILSYISISLNMVVNLLYTPIMIRLLGQSEYGLYTLVGSIVSYLSLFSLGFTGAYLRFYSRYKSKNDLEGEFRLNGMFLSLFLGMGLAALICGFVLAQYPQQIFGQNLSAQELKTAQGLMYILVFNIALTFPSSIMESIVGAHEQFIFQQVLTFIGIILNPLICLPLLLMGYGSVAVVSVVTFITVFKLVCNTLFCFKRLKVKFFFYHFEFSILKEIFVFSFFLFLNMIIDQINWSVDKLILGHTSGTNAVAVYGVAGQINSIFMTFSTTISSVFSPRINKIAAEGKDVKKRFTSLFIKVGRIQFMVLGLVASGFVYFGKYFITQIYVGEEYAESYAVALFLILPAMVPLCQNLGLEIQRSVNMHQFRSIIYFFMAFVNVLISIPLAQKFGPAGAAMGTAISLLIANGFIMNVFYSKAIGIDIVAFWKSILHLFVRILPAMVVGIIVLKLIVFHGIVEYLVWIVIYTVIYCGSVWFLGMNLEEKMLILKPIQKIFGLTKRSNKK